MPCDYEILKKHVTVAHPEILDAFLESWKSLDSSGKHGWAQKSILKPREKAETIPWLSWTTFIIDRFNESRRDHYSIPETLSSYERRLGVLFHDVMEHSGSILGFPYMPPLRDRVYPFPNAQGNSRTERHSIAKDAAKTIIHAELRKLVMKWEKDLEEHGIDALRKVYFANPLEEDEDEFDMSDSALEVDCDSASDFSDIDIYM